MRTGGQRPSCVRSDCRLWARGWPPGGFGTSGAYLNATDTIGVTRCEETAMEWDQEFDAPPMGNTPVDQALPVVARQVFSEHNEVAHADFDQFRDVLNSRLLPG